MAATLRLTQSMTYKRTGEAVTLSGQAFSEDVGGPYCTETQNIPDGVWVALDVGDSVSSAGLFFVIIGNLDEHHLVTISRTNDDTGKITDIQPGEGTTLTLNADYLPYLKATGGVVKVEFLAVSNPQRGAPLV